MMWWQACLWGALGAGLVEAREMRQLYRVQGHFPWVKDGTPQVKPYLFAVFLRFFMACGITAAYGVGGQVAGPLAAVTLGIAAPIIVQQIADASPVGQTPAGPEETVTNPPGRLPAHAPESGTEEQPAHQPPPPSEPGRSHDGR